VANRRLQEAEKLRRYSTSSSNCASDRPNAGFAKLSRLCLPFEPTVRYHRTTASGSTTPSSTKACRYCGEFIKRSGVGTELDKLRPWDLAGIR